MNKLTSSIAAISAVMILTFSNCSNADQATINSIEAASHASDISTLKQLASTVDGYEKALAQYRLAIGYNISDQSDQANLAIEKAQQILETLMEAQPTSEHAALLSQVYGYRIFMSPIKGAYYGPKSSEMLETAFTLNSSNPRAYLVKGISAYNTPTMFGGSKQVALDTLNDAIELYRRADPQHHNWGYSEAYVWRGLTHLALDNKAQAKQDFKQALTLSPNYDWARMLLADNKENNN
ncbi:tetratricopeptide repeat protein [Pseudoalteromonas sp. T1lg65]|uniref:tetratricopeptide repeat protein n=1 Tax=Pseudoalteromonas sp. T1lg65 TaxID=2077101 RepID=UPI003F7AE0A3